MVMDCIGTRRNKGAIRHSPRIGRLSEDELAELQDWDEEYLEADKETHAPTCPTSPQRAYGGKPIARVTMGTDDVVVGV